VFTDSPLTLLQAEADHREHAIIEQVIADLKNGSLTHLPSGRFNANGAWLVLATMSINLTRAAGALASRFHAKASTATIRTQLINVPRSVRPLRPAPSSTPTCQLALGRRVAQPIHHSSRATNTTRQLTTHAASGLDRSGVLRILDRASRLRGSVHARATPEVQSAVQG
jgi:hypothetical protein